MKADFGQDGGTDGGARSLDEAVTPSMEKANSNFGVHSVKIKNVSNYPAGSDNTTGTGYRLADNDKSIASGDGNVKNSLCDSDGNKLSKERQEYSD